MSICIELAQLMEVTRSAILTAQVPQPVQIKIYSDDQNTLDTTASRKVAAQIGKIQGGDVDVTTTASSAYDALELQGYPVRGCGG